MFRLGLWAQIILPYPPVDYRSRVIDLSAADDNATKCLKASVQSALPVGTKSILKDAGVNTDTLEELLMKLNDLSCEVQTSEMGTQTPVEFYFHLDFDLHEDSTDDAVDGIMAWGIFVDFKTGPVLDADSVKLDPVAMELVGKVLRKISDSDDFCLSYGRDGERDAA